MLALWIILAAVVWLALMTLVVALCAASARADRTLVRRRLPLRISGHRHRPGRYTHA